MSGVKFLPPGRHFTPLIKALLDNYRNLYLNFFTVNFWLATYDQFMVILPYSPVSEPFPFCSVPQLFRFLDSFSLIPLHTFLETSRYPQNPRERVYTDKLQKWERPSGEQFPGRCQ